MSIEPIKAEVQALLKQANEKIGLAERRLETGTDSERVRAAGRLAVLKGKRENLEARARELDACPDNAVTSIVQRIREEWFLLMADVGGLIESP